MLLVFVSVSDLIRNICVSFFYLLRSIGSSLMGAISTKIVDYQLGISGQVTVVGFNYLICASVCTTEFERDLPY